MSYKSYIVTWVLMMAVASRGDEFVSALTHTTNAAVSRTDTVVVNTNVASGPQSTRTMTFGDMAGLLGTNVGFPGIVAHGGLTTIYGGTSIDARGGIVVANGFDETGGGSMFGGVFNAPASDGVFSIGDGTPFQAAFDGTLQWSGVATGNGSGIRALNASQLSSGTLPNATFPAVLPAASGANLTALNASQLSSGTLPNATFPATLPAASGANLTALNASQLSSGTLPNGRFPAVLPGVSGESLTNILRGYITPFDCGAVGDGVTDDAAALKKWLFIGCSSNWICFLPPAPGGSYACSTTLQITNGMNHVNIQGPGGAVFNSDGPNQNFAVIKITAAVDGLVVTNVASNLQINGIRLTNSAAYSFSTHGFWVNGNTGDSDCSSIRNCSAQGFGRGLELSSVADTTVENCSFGVDGVGIEIAGGTYANPPIINQVRISGCQLSYSYTNQVHITNAGQYVLIQNCDMAPQVGATDAALKIERNAYVTLSDMHIEPYNSKPCIIVTDNGAGAGGTFLNLQNVACSLDGTAANATTYSLVATNANVTFMNVGLSDVADGAFSILWQGDVNVFRSDKSILSRMVAGGILCTNYLGGNFIMMKNSGVVGSYIREGEFLREFADLNSNPGGGIGGGFIWSHLYYGARTFDSDNSLGVTAINLTGYYEDRALNGTGVGITNASGLILYGGSLGGMCKTNLATAAINMTTPVALLPISGPTTFTALTGVDTTKTMVQHVLTIVTNSAVGTSALTMPANVVSVGSLTVTRRTHIDWWVYASLMTNAIVTPIN